MELNRDIIDKLFAFKATAKFSNSAWNGRGLNPSAPEMSAYLENNFNEIADDLIVAVNADYSARRLRSILKNGLNRFQKSDYDTEEKEFICDVFDMLSKIVNIDVAGALNAWLYGSILSTLLKIGKTINPERIVETITQPCTNCNADLDTIVLQKQEGIPDHSWEIVRCNSCGEYNLLSPGPDIKISRYGNYTLAESLDKDEFTLEQALIRLEQIKFFRKS